MNEHGEKVEKPFQCQQCDFSSFFKFEFRNHMKRHEGKMLKCLVS